MLRLEFTEDRKQVLHYEWYHHPHPHVRQKIEVLWLKSQGLSHREIARLAGVSENTLRSYLRNCSGGRGANLLPGDVWLKRSEAGERCPGRSG